MSYSTNKATDDYLIVCQVANLQPGKIVPAGRQSVHHGGARVRSEGEC
jgi:hypothetical protein